MNLTQKARKILSQVPGLTPRGLLHHLRMDQNDEVKVALAAYILKKLREPPPPPPFSFWSLREGDIVSFNCLEGVVLEDSNFSNGFGYVVKFRLESGKVLIKPSHQLELVRRKDVRSTD